MLFTLKVWNIYKFIFFSIFELKFNWKGFESNENSSIINTLSILYDDIDIYTGFPTEFKINLKDLNNTNIRFIKIAKNDNHPIFSDDIYTVDTNHKATKVNIPNTHNEVNK